MLVWFVSTFIYSSRHSFRLHSNHKSEDKKGSIRFRWRLNALRINSLIMSNYLLAASESSDSSLLNTWYFSLRQDNLFSRLDLFLSLTMVVDLELLLYLLGSINTATGGALYRGIYRPDGISEGRRKQQNWQSTNDKELKSMMLRWVSLRIIWLGAIRRRQDMKWK